MEVKKTSGSSACLRFSAAMRKKQAPIPELRASASPNVVAAWPDPLSLGCSRKQRVAPKQPRRTAPIVTFDTGGPLRHNHAETSPKTNQSEDMDSNVAACAMDVRIREDWNAPRLMLSAKPAPTSSITSERVRRMSPRSERPRLWWN
eukprot:scaffold215972_cov36-Tisochrysis_lutea.AAC.3